MKNQVQFNLQNPLKTDVDLNNSGFPYLIINSIGYRQPEYAKCMRIYGITLRTKSSKPIHAILKAHK